MRQDAPSVVQVREDGGWVRGVRGLDSRGVVKFAATITSSSLLSVHVGTHGFICRIKSSK